MNFPNSTPKSSDLIEFIKLYKVLFTTQRYCSLCNKPIPKWEYAYITFGESKRKAYCKQCANELEVKVLQ